MLPSILSLVIEIKIKSSQNTEQKCSIPKCKQRRNLAINRVLSCKLNNYLGGYCVRSQQFATSGEHGMINSFKFESLKATSFYTQAEKFNYTSLFFHLTFTRIIQDMKVNLQILFRIFCKYSLIQVSRGIFLVKLFLLNSDRIAMVYSQYRYDRPASWSP